jgi:hypothetical protein
MLTLEDTLSSQNDLQALCADRTLRTREVFAPNAYYGIDRILKEYAGLPDNRPLKAVLPHGVVLDENYVWEAEKKALVPAVFCYPPYRERAYRAQTDKKVFLSAAPFLYLIELLRGQPQPARQGTIFFPQHSTHYVTAEMDFEGLAEELVQFGLEYQPVTICMYWRSLNLGHHLPFRKRGMRIVSAGHMYDPVFLYRLYHLCSLHQYASGNGLGSHMFYSLKSGCSYFHFDRVRPRLTADGSVLKRDVAKTSLAIESALEALFRDPQPSATPEQLDAADYYLGADHLRSPQELRQLLLRAEILDKAGFCARGSAGSTGFAVPTYYRRSGRALKREVGGIGRRLFKSWTTAWKGFRS